VRRGLQTIKDWPDVSKQPPNAMVEKSSQPDETTARMLIWNENGPWLRTIGYKEPVDHDLPMPHQDVLEQFGAYEVPADKFDELAAYGGSVISETALGQSRLAGRSLRLCAPGPWSPPRVQPVFCIRLAHSVVNATGWTGCRAPNKARHTASAVARLLTEARLSAFGPKRSKPPKFGGVDECVYSSP